MKRRDGLPMRRRISCPPYQVDENGCWIWQWTVNVEGYGRFSDGGINLAAHRWMYEIHKGPIPDGLHIDHLCRVTRCVNPDHLEAVTQAENNRRKALVITHCPRGHEYTPENTYRRPKGNRSCQICNRASRAARHRRAQLNR